jgi:hypothetical protein
MKNIDKEVKLGGLGDDYPKPILIKNLGMMYVNEGSKWKRRYGLYKCGFCGTEFKTRTSSIKNGSSKSCGCYNTQRVKEGCTKHNLSHSKINNIWRNIKNRTKQKYNINYGGRGITICEEWKNDFKAFYDWSILNGYEENKDLSIDRIDNNGNYCPENCRWTTSIIQNRNRRIRKDNTSGYRGVCYNKAKNNYISRISIDKKRIHLGTFPTAVEGAIAYNNYIIENTLEGFILNEIPNEYQE